MKQVKIEDEIVYEQDPYKIIYRKEFLTDIFKSESTLHKFILCKDKAWLRGTSFQQPRYTEINLEEITKQAIQTLKKHML